MKRTILPLNKQNNVLKSAITGAGAGLVNGLFGGGGGMIVVPMLNMILGFDNKCSHATAILIILPVSIVSGAIYTVFGNFDGGIIFPVTVGTFIGGLIGALFLKKASGKIIIIIFSSLMLFAGVKLLVF